MKKFLLVCLFILFTSNLLFAQSTLSAGDIAIIGFNFDNPDEFAFVALIDLESGTQINFTDNGWQASGSFRGGEGTDTWTASSAISAGTIVTVNPSSMALSSSGDQILAYQGTEESPTFIYALNSEGTGWQSDATSSNTSALPTGLTNGSTAIALDEIDNSVYDMSTTEGTQNELLTAISNTSNWSGSDSERQTMPSGSFTVTQGTTTTVQFTASSASVSEGSGTYNLDVSITNPDGINDTSADVVLISGSAADIDNYTTQSVTFPAGSSDNQTVTITITDDSEVEGNETLTFELQNVTGGNSAAAGTPSQFDLTIEDNDLPNAWINEIHYDNDGTDENEGVEVVIENPGSYTLADFTVTLYNGSGGSSYDTKTINNFTSGNTEGNFTLYYYAYPENGIQNGPDGIALDYKGNLIQFLSYEGNFAATDGPANGQTSTDIGVEETGSTLSTQSMQLTGNGTQYSDFTWQADLTQTWGTQNDGGDQSLPVELTTFAAFAGDGQIILRWQTASEINNAGFIILRSTEELSGYKQVDSYRDNPDLKGAGTTSAENNYNWIDRNVSNNLTYWYKLVDVDINGRRTEHGPVAAAPGAENSEINQMQGVLPEKFDLRQNYPNPFNPQTSVRFDLPMIDDGMLYVRLEIFDLVGRKVRTLISGEIPCGSYTVRWNGLNEQGRPLPSGIYFYRLATAHYSKSRKMVLAR